ncbi:MAG: CDP-alcohol phosphatidyltransferase family protein [Bacteroidota bacterium]
MPHPPPTDRPLPLRTLLGRFWTVANMLSLFRVVLVVPLTYTILTDGPLSWIIGLVLVAAATDWLDGRIARWSHTVSEWGKVLDPLADKVAAAAVVTALVVKGSLPWWFIALILVRDVLIIYGGIVVARRTNHVVMSAWLGKVAVTGIAVTVIAALLRADAPVLQALVGITSLLLVVSFFIYLIRGLRVLHAGTPTEERLARVVEDERIVAALEPVKAQAESLSQSVREGSQNVRESVRGKVSDMKQKLPESPSGHGYTTSTS